MIRDTEIHSDHEFRSVESCALTIARMLSVASSKDLAEARRMNGDGCGFYWRMMAHLGISGEVNEHAWMVYMRCAALLTASSSKDGFHDPSRKFGAVLADGGQSGRIDRPFISEARLSRLLSSRGQQRLVALERIVRSVSRVGTGMDAPSLAWAILNPNGSQIARDYYYRLDFHFKDKQENFHAE